MPDICTMVLISMMNAIGCYNPQAYCAPSSDRTKQLCIPNTTCPLPPPSYDCVKEDGTHYSYQESSSGGTESVR
jgi:hypothetical protein